MPQWRASNTKRPTRMRGGFAARPTLGCHIRFGRNDAPPRVPSPAGADSVVSMPAVVGPLDIARRELQLEPPDRAVVAEIIAGLRRVVAGKHDRHRGRVGIERLRIIDPAAEEIGIVAAGRRVRSGWRDKGETWAGVSASTPLTFTIGGLSG